MSLRYALLGALADRPRTGYELLKHFEQSLAYAWPASHSQIYPELARLLDDGLIEQAATGPRGSKTYAVTDDGVAEVRRWLRETKPDRRVRSEGALRPFFLWLLEPDEAIRQLEAERAYWRGILDELEAIREQPAGTSRKEQTFRIVLEGGIRSVSARLEWLEWAVGEVGSPAWRDA
jgi:PadR family transcriptional regulator, regulatory protein AphA